jgi:hypothetical protein
MIKIRNNFLKTLGLSGQHALGMRTESYSEDEVEQFKVHHQQCILLWKLRFDAKYSSRKDNNININCNAKLELLQWFESKSKRDDESYLFEDLEECAYGSFFQKWNVKFENTEILDLLKRETKRAKKEFIGIDDGKTCRENFS